MTLHGTPAPERRGLSRVLNLFDTTTKVLVAVGGLIAAAGALWLTVSSIVEPSAPALPQTPSTSSPTTSSPTTEAPKTADAQTAAERVNSCQSQHHMEQQRQKVNRGVGAYAFVACDWPLEKWSQADGYSEITVLIQKGPGTSEATGASEADQISGPCTTYVLAYDFNKQGANEHRPEFVAKPGVFLLGTPDKPYNGQFGPLGFYPTRDEVVQLHNDSFNLYQARCGS